MPRVPKSDIERLAAELGERGRVLDPIPRTQTQQGPNCGFYALSIVLEYWKDKKRISETLPARKRDTREGDKPIGTTQVSSKDTKPKSLRQLGKQKGALNIREKLNAPTEKKNASVGGVFRAEQLGEVAKAFNKKLSVELLDKRKPEDFVTEICSAIDHGIPPIVAFDAKEGEPVTFDEKEQRGQSSHWGVVIGYYTEKECLHFLATHGHGGYYDWIAEDLRASNFALSGTTRNEPELSKVRPQEGPALSFIKADPEKSAALAKAKLPAWETTRQFQKIRLALKRPGVLQDPQEFKDAYDVQQDLAHYILEVNAPEAESEVKAPEAESESGTT